MTRDSSEDPSAPTGASPRRRSPARWLREEWSQHLGVLVPAFLAVLIAERLYAVGHWNVQTALGVLQASGPANVLVGTTTTFVAAALPIAWMAVIPHFVYRIAAGVGFGAASHAVVVTTISFVFMLGLLIASPLVLTFTLCLVAFTIYLGLRDRRTRVRRSLDLEWGLNPIVSILLITYLVGTDPWLPREAIGVNGADPIVGYVLDDADRVAVLRSSPRQIVYLEQEDVTGRTLCSMGAPSLWFSPASTLIGKRSLPQYPLCPR